MRVEHVRFGECAKDTAECATNVERFDVNAIGASVHWWVTPWAAASLSAFHYGWDAAPYDEATVRSTSLLLARLTLSVR